MKMKRSVRFRYDQLDAIKAKRVNRIKKTAERARRDVRMMAKIKAGELPYTPVVMNWLSAELGKKSSRITEADVKTIVG